MTVRLPDALIAQIAAESRERNISRSDVVRERLQAGSEQRRRRRRRSGFELIADLAGSVDGLPSDSSARKKHYLKSTGYGRSRSR